jgi:hypothetical protein
MKGFQHRYYVRMREIEYTAYLINRVPVGGKYGNKEISAPRIDMSWGFKGYRVAAQTSGGDDWRADEPSPREPQEIHRALRRRFWLPNVAMPHVLAVVLGSALFIAAALHAPNFEQLHP